MSTINLNKSPRSDGLSIECYKCFSEQIMDRLINNLNKGYGRQGLSFTQRQTILTLLFQKGTKEFLDNWRPISLLQIDYKIAKRVLSIGLQQNMPGIISADQRGFI